MDVPAWLRGGSHDRPVSFLHLSLDQKTIELTLKRPRFRKDKEPADFCIEPLCDVKRRAKSDSQLMENVLHTVIDSRVNGNAGRFVHDNEVVVAVHDCPAPIDITGRKALGH